MEHCSPRRPGPSRDLSHPEARPTRRNTHLPHTHSPRRGVYWTPGGTPCPSHIRSTSVIGGFRIASRGRKRRYSSPRTRGPRDGLRNRVPRREGWVDGQRGGERKFAGCWYPRPISGNGELPQTGRPFLPVPSQATRDPVLLPSGRGPRDGVRYHIPHVERAASKPTCIVSCQGLPEVVMSTCKGAGRLSEELPARRDGCVRGVHEGGSRATLRGHK